MQSSVALQCRPHHRSSRWLRLCLLTALLSSPAAAAELATPIAEPSVGADFSAELWRSSLDAALLHTARRLEAQHALPQDAKLATRIGRHRGEWVVELLWSGKPDPALDSTVLLARHTAVITGGFNDLLFKVPDMVAASATAWLPAHDDGGALAAHSDLRVPATTPTLAPPLTLEQEDGSRTFVLPLAAAGVAVAGVVVGAVFQALNSQGTAQVQYSPINGGEGRSPLNLAVAANVAFGVAGLAAITGGVLLLVDYTSGDAENAQGSAGSATLVVPF